MPKRRSDELAAIDEVMPLVDRFNELEHAQRLIFLDMVDPLPEEVAPTKKSQKKTSKKWSKPATKSERASGMAAQLKSRVNEQREAATTTKDDNYDPLTGLRCSREGCGWLQGDLIHDPQGGYAGYHPFQPSATAPPAAAPSPANGGAGSTAQSLEASAASAQAATGGSGE